MAENEGSASRVPVPREWYRSVYTSNVEYRWTAERTQRHARALGLLAVVFASATGTAMFATLEESPSQTVRIVTGVVALLAALAAAANTFLGLDEREDRYRKAAATYEGLKHELEAHGVKRETQGSGGNWTKKDLGDFQARWKAINKAAPTLPLGAWPYADDYVRARLGMKRPSKWWRLVQRRHKLASSRAVDLDDLQKIGDTLREMEAKVQESGEASATVLKRLTELDKKVTEAREDTKSQLREFASHMPEPVPPGKPPEVGAPAYSGASAPGSATEPASCGKEAVQPAARAMKPTEPTSASG